MFFNINNVELEMGKCIVCCTCRFLPTFIPPAYRLGALRVARGRPSTTFEACSLNTQ
jgi:hypothetical protein